MITKNIIIDLLQMTSQEYDDLIFLQYWNYCALYGRSPSEVQQLLANNRLNKYFVTELEKLEREFIKMTAHLKNKTDVYEYHYKGCVSQIFRTYPKALIDETKLSKDFISNPLKNMPFVYAN